MNEHFWDHSSVLEISIILHVNILKTIAHFFRIFHKQCLHWPPELRKVTTQRWVRCFAGYCAQNLYNQRNAVSGLCLKNLHNNVFRLESWTESENISHCLKVVFNYFITSNSYLNILFREKRRGFPKNNVKCRWSLLDCGQSLFSRV